MAVLAVNPGGRVQLEEMFDPSKECTVSTRDVPHDLLASFLSANLVPRNTPISDRLGKQFSPAGTFSTSPSRMSAVPLQDTGAAEGSSSCRTKAADQHELYGGTGVSSDELPDDLLGQMGYDSQLQRNRSTAHVAFMAFVLAANPYGLATTLNYPLIGGGPVNIIWGWLLVALIVVCVAASLGEITSVYPTAGGIPVPAPRTTSMPCQISDTPLLTPGV